MIKRYKNRGENNFIENDGQKTIANGVISGEIWLSANELVINLQGNCSLGLGTDNMLSRCQGPGHIVDKCMDNRA